MNHDHSSITARDAKQMEHVSRKFLDVYLEVAMDDRLGRCMEKAHALHNVAQNAHQDVTFEYDRLVVQQIKQ